MMLADRREFRLSRDSDMFHGGILAALVDVTGHAAVAVKVGHVAPTIDLRIDYVQPAPGCAIGRADIEVCVPDGPAVVSGRGTVSTLSASRRRVEGASPCVQ